MVKKYGIVKHILIISAICIMLSFNGCGKSNSWACSMCRTDLGDKDVAYYGSTYGDILCKSCAVNYWNPLPIENYTVTYDEYLNYMNSNAGNNQDSDSEIRGEENDYPQHEYFNFKAMGDFSEGLAFVVKEVASGYTGRYYIDKTGKVVITLPDTVDYGYEFHEGYAVICSDKVGHNAFDVSWKAANAAIIDKEGNYLFEPGKYDFYSRVSEGLVCAFDYEETYQGSSSTTYILDLDGNVVWSMDGVPGCCENVYYIDGILAIGDKCYDKKGNVVFDAKDSSIYLEQRVSPDADSVIIEYNATKKVKVFNRKKLEMSTYDIDFYSPFVHLSGQFFYGGYIAFVKDNKLNFLKEDGTITTISDYPVFSVESTEQALWIIQLENSYYSVVGPDGKFIIEPIQSEIYNLGDGLFQIQSDCRIIDSKGNTVQSPGVLLNYYGHRYHDDMLFGGYGSYYDKDGNCLNQAYIE